MRSHLVQTRPLGDLEQSILLDIFNSARAEAGCFSGKAVDGNGFAALVEGGLATLLVREAGRLKGFRSAGAVGEL